MVKRGLVRIVNWNIESMTNKIKDAIKKKENLNKDVVLLS